LIRSPRGLISVGALTLLFALIILLPARVAIHWFLPAEILVSGVQGSVWHGGAAEASVNGAYLRNLQWDFRLLQVFTGKLPYRVSATPVYGSLESDVSIGLDGTVFLADLSAQLPLVLFAGVSGVKGLQGDATLAFDRVEIIDGLAAVANGRIDVSNLIVPDFGQNSLGGYTIEFFTQNNGIAASIEDTDGVVDLAGSLQIRRDRSFDFLGQVIVKPETPQAVLQQLKGLPPADERGQQELRLEGIL
jgi:general secretion pathway protein N